MKVLLVVIDAYILQNRHSIFDNNYNMNLLNLFSKAEVYIDTLFLYIKNI